VGLDACIAPQLLRRDKPFVPALCDGWQTVIRTSPILGREVLLRHAAAVVVKVAAQWHAGANEELALSAPGWAGKDIGFCEAKAPSPKT
jgi:hypothetical protein